MLRATILCCLLMMSSVWTAEAWGQGGRRRPIVHDAEYYVLAAQNGLKENCRRRNEGSDNARTLNAMDSTKLNVEWLLTPRPEARHRKYS